MNEKTIHDFCNSKNMGKGIHYNISSNINLFLSEEWLLTYLLDHFLYVCWDYYDDVGGGYFDKRG